MVNPKLIMALGSMMQSDDADNRNLVTVAFAPLVILMLLLLFVVYILLAPIGFLTGVFFPEETAAAEGLKSEYGYILEDLEEYGGYTWPAIIGGDTSGNHDGQPPNNVTIDPAEIAAMLGDLDIPPGKQKLIYNAVSLVGKVDYFWGGKSSAGWNDAWGEPRAVSAAGSKNTGKIMPYGLDCSGFVDWAFKTSGYGNIMAGGTSYQWGQCNAIKEENLQPGDLAFKNQPGRKGVNHVGIYLGEQNGRQLFVHCAGGQGVTVDSWDGFVYFRRPLIDFEK